MKTEVQLEIKISEREYINCKSGSGTDGFLEKLNRAIESSTTTQKTDEKICANQVSVRNQLPLI